MTALFSSSSLNDISSAMLNLFNAQMNFGSDLLQSVTGTSGPSVTDQLQTLQKRMTTTCCTIPAPCWMPQSLGDCTSHVSQCNTACIELVVTNCDRVSHPLSVSVSGDPANAVTVTPATATLGPLMRQRVKVCLNIPTDAKSGDSSEMLILVQGCRDYYLRWTVSIGTVGIDSCHQISVDDCPDFIHHWYDHFYCRRGCLPRNQGTTPSTNIPGVAANG